MKKSLLITSFCLTMGVASIAQLSTRENYDMNSKLGARPQSGDAALQFVVPIVEMSEDSSAALFNGNFLRSGDFLTYKYYMTDSRVVRLGLRYTMNNSSSKGAGADSSYFNPVIPDAVIKNFKMREISRDLGIAIGLEQHFTSSNILDVYAAGEILLGLGKDKTIENMEYESGDVSNTTRSTATRILGLGLFTGVNIFVAELPISIGLEYGLTGKFRFGGKTKVTREETVGSDNESAEWIEDGTDTSPHYSDFSKRTFMMDTNQNVRLSIHFYFSTLRD